jgi:hypothetical protein
MKSDYSVKVRGYPPQRAQRYAEDKAMIYRISIIPL